MARPTETERTYLEIINDPGASTQQRLDASTALDKLRTRRTHYRNHTKAKKLLGLKAKEKTTAPTPGAVHTRELQYSEGRTEADFRIVLLSEGSQIWPPATPAELAAAKELTAHAEAFRQRLKAEQDALFAKFTPTKN